MRMGRVGRTEGLRTGGLDLLSRPSIRTALQPIARAADPDVPEPARTSPTERQVSEGQAVGERDAGAAGEEQQQGTLLELTGPAQRLDARLHGCAQCASPHEHPGAGLGKGER